LRNPAFQKTGLPFLLNTAGHQPYSRLNDRWLKQTHIREAKLLRHFFAILG
jgi:hypothetical protein